MTIEKVLFYYYIVCFFMAFFMEWQQLHKDGFKLKDFLGYIFFVAILGFITVPVYLLSDEKNKK